MCGEHTSANAQGPFPFGSSPRVRGTFERLTIWRLARRFIPACAGNITSSLAYHWHKPVHPRVCGEHRSIRVYGAKTIGSSPRVRGTYPQCATLHVKSRFIPACAGNILSRSAPRGDPAVHPRVCGEHSSPACSRHFKSGSSPRVRGTCPKNCSDDNDLRFIPACAGNIQGATTISLFISVHPRVCGEHLLAAPSPLIPCGSSPRVRGTSVRKFNDGHRLRFIPACAGNICEHRRRRFPGPVHPRVCGEHTGNGIRSFSNSGSSPRVRGTSARDYCG